jgi:hypothetical protein
MVKILPGTGWLLQEASVAARPQKNTLIPHLKDMIPLAQAGQIGSESAEGLDGEEVTSLCGSVGA